MGQIPPDWAQLISADDVEWSRTTRRVRHAKKPSRARLDPEQIEEIRASAEPQRQLAAKYGVHQSRISRIKNGKMNE